jgi:PST family polysaccharide transporter
MQSNFSTSVLSGLGWMSLSSLLQAGLKLAVLAVLSRLLPPRDFGLVGIALIFTSCAERVGQVGVGPAMIQRRELAPDEVWSGFILSLISGILIAGALWVIAPYVAVFFDQAVVEELVRALALGFILDGVAVVPDSLLQRTLRFRELTVVENGAYSLGIAGVGITAALLGAGVWALVAGQLGMKVARLFLLLRCERLPRPMKFNYTAARELLQAGFGFSLGRVLNFASLQGDNFVVGRVLGAELLGVYTRAYQLMALPAVYIGQVLERVLFPALAQKQGERQVLVRAYCSALEVISVVALPTSVALWGMAPEVVRVLFGAQWVESASIVSVLAFGVFFRTAYKCSDTLVRSQGAVYQYAACQALYALTVVAGALIGSLWVGVLGVAVAVVLAVGVNYLLLTWCAARLLSLPLRRLGQAHLGGIWISAWVAAALLCILPPLRHAESSALFVLTVSTVTAVCAALVGFSCAPPAVRSPMVTRMMARLLVAQRGTH